MSAWFRDSILQQPNPFQERETGRIVLLPQIPVSPRLTLEPMSFFRLERKGGQIRSEGISPKECWEHKEDGEPQTASNHQAGKTGRGWD